MYLSILFIFIIKIVAMQSIIIDWRFLSQKEIMHITRIYLDYNK